MSFYGYCAHSTLVRTVVECDAESADASALLLEHNRGRRRVPLREKGNLKPLTQSSLRKSDTKKRKREQMYAAAGYGLEALKRVKASLASGAAAASTNGDVLPDMVRH